MKIFFLVTLLVCGVTQGDNTQNEIFSTSDNVETKLQNTHLALNLVSSYAVNDEELILSETNVETRNVVADAIADLLESFRDIVIHGNDDIPPLDPLVVSVMGPYNHKITGVSASITIKNLRMEGLRWYVVDHVKFNPVRLSFGTHITIPWITTTGSYDARARVGLLNHKAGGRFRVFAHRIEFGLDMRLGTNIFGGGHLILRELDIKIDIHDTHIQLSGMTGSVLVNNFISGMVQNLSQEIIQNELENVSKLLSEQLFDVINEVLKDYSMNDIMGLDTILN